MSASTERVDDAGQWHRGSWMQTYTGRRLFPMDPSPADVDIIDIAHALSMQCRYNGHVRRFMSVAEHCVLISENVPAQDALWGLLHDATEAYVGDMIRPLRDQVAYVDQDLMHEACTSAGGLPAPITRAVCGTCFTEVSVSGGCMC